MVLKLKLSLLLIMGTVLSGILQLNAAEIESALAACKNITVQQRQMAKAAGYDVDSLCAAAASEDTTAVDTSKPLVVTPKDLTAKPADEALEKIFAISVEALKYVGGKNPKRGKADFEAIEGKEGFEDEDGDTEQAEEQGGLKQFGYDLFAGVPTTFAPATEIPVVSNYVIGPGDTINVQLFGKISESHTLTVSRNGTVQFPVLGPINLSGLTYDEMKELLSQRVTKQMIGVQASITLGELRSIRIFILGDVTRPGSYTVSSLSSMTNALFVGGGIRKIGSLRNIQLKRQGKVVTTLDLYDLLLKGDTSNDVRLLPGDVIFIPPIANTVGIAGEVKRPAIYELKHEKHVSDLVILAGGYLPGAYPKASRLERINLNGDRTILDVDLNSDVGANIKLVNGDLLHVYSVLKKMEKIVTLEGHVYRPGGFSFRPGMKVSDLVKSIDNLLPASDLDYALLIRETQPTREMEVLQVNLRAIFIGKDNSADVILHVKDRLIILAATESRENVLAPIIMTLKAQERQSSAAKIVSVTGTIRFTGEYPLTVNMSVNDLIDAGGGLQGSTYISAAEITRKDYSNPEAASIKHFTIALDNYLENQKSNPELLVAGDHLNLKLIPRFQEKLIIILQGEVKFPGSYEFIRGETLSDIIQRAGGLTNLAHVEAAFFSRDDLKKKEAKQIKDFQERLKSDLAAAQLEDVNSDKKADITTLNTLLETIEDSKATGRLVINLAAILSHSVEDLQLRNNDLLIIPTYRQEVTIIGEVQNPTSHLFNIINDHTDYINKSGGITEKADESRIYVIKADGSVFLPQKSGWFHDDVTISPGDTIVVPIETDRLDNLTLWSSVSQIIYQMALGAAAVKAF